MTIEISQLRYAVLTADTQSFSRAAQAMNVKQSRSRGESAAGKASNAFPKPKAAIPVSATHRRWQRMNVKRVPTVRSGPSNDSNVGVGGAFPAPTTLTEA